MSEVNTELAHLNRVEDSTERRLNVEKTELDQTEVDLVALRVRLEKLRAAIAQRA